MTTALVTALAEAPPVRAARRAGTRGVSVDPQRERLARAMYQDAASRRGAPALPWEQLGDVELNEWLLRADAARAAISVTAPLSEAALEEAITQYIEQDARLFVLTAGMTLAAFEAGFATLRDRVAARAAAAIMAQVRDAAPGAAAMANVEVVACSSCGTERPASWFDDDGVAYCERCVKSIIARQQRESAHTTRATGSAPTTHCPRSATTSALSIRDGWLVTGDCTCTAKAKHTETQECGHIPVAQLAALPGWREMVSKHALSVLGEVDSAIEKAVTKLFAQHSLSASSTNPGVHGGARDESA